MEYVSSCQAIGIWESLCVKGIDKGYVELVHDGKANKDISVYTRVYNVHLKSELEPVRVKFFYDQRVKDKATRKDVATVDVSLVGLILILQAMVNREIEIDIDALDFRVTKDKEGLKIVHKEE